MRTLTLIPEAQTYGLAILTVLTLGSFSLASHVHARWFPGTAGPGLVAANAWIKGVAAGWALLVLPVQPLLGGAPWRLGLALPAGLCGAWAAVQLERLIIRRSADRRMARARGRQASAYDGSLRARRVSAPGMGAAHGVDPFTLVPATSTVRFSLGLVCFVGALEEVLYRGFLLQLCRSLDPTWFAAAALAGVTIIFGISHISFGWGQVLAKTLLGSLTLLLTLALDNVLAAVVAHVGVNAAAWLEQRRRMPQERMAPAAPLGAGGFR